MRAEVISDEEFFVFINNLYANIDDYDDKDQITDVVKDVISKLKSRLRLRGFYKLKVFVNSKIGLFIDGVRLESFDRSNGLDLRIVVYFDEDIYFKTDDYFLINYIDNIRYFDGNYYCLVDDIFDINEVVEFGEFVYGSLVFEMLDKGIKV